MDAPPMDAIVLLEEAVAEEERGSADAMAAWHGVLVTAMVAGEVFVGGLVRNVQLLDALERSGTASPAMERCPVVGFGSAARHAILLAYDDWPVAVAVGADFNPATAPLSVKPLVVSVAEADAGAILLLVTDVAVNGPFVTLTDEALDTAGIHWETIRYGRTSPQSHGA